VDFIYSELDGEKINLGSYINGDVKTVSYNIVNILRNLFEIKGKPFWFVCGGETTVNVTGNGYGGRNQELAVRMMENMDKKEEFLFISIGTDGIDGKSTAAGGIVDNSTKIENLETYIDNNDTYTALSQSNGAIITGRTGNNVSDIMLGYYGQKQ
jgi:glycerate 2-kinase